MYAKLGIAAAGLTLAALLGPTPASAQGVACPVKIGTILPLTGSFAPVAARIALSTQLAIEHMNEGGGVKGCKVEAIMRDDQGQPTVGVDAAKYLVEVEKVAALAGTISSGVTGPIIATVSGPSKVVQVSCCSTAPNFTLDGRSNGYFFRTLPTSKTQAYATAAEMQKQGFKKLSIIYVNNDFGTITEKYIADAMKKFGTEVVSEVPYNDNQQSYRAEVSKALAAKPESLMLVGFPKDAVTIVREWLSLGGPQKFALNNAMRVKEFVDGVGAKFLEGSFGMDNAQVAGPQVDLFNKLFKEKFNQETNSPGVHTQYDAFFVLGLAMNVAKDLTGPSIKDAMRMIQSDSGTKVGTGPDEYKKALALIKEGKPIKYYGATGPIEFDANGDVNGPALVWKIKGGEIVTDYVISIEEMQALFKKIDG